jgi:hypothetical protein
MKFGISQLLRPTPETLLKYGHTLKGIALAASGTVLVDPSHYAVSAVVAVIAIAGNFLTCMFGEKNK